MNWNLILYILVSTAIVLGASASYVSKQQMTTAIILFIGLSAAAVYFAVQWFTSYGYVQNEGGNWPPDGTITVCPDFLTLVKKNGVYVCQDKVGLGFTGDFDLKVGDAKRAQALCDQCKLPTPRLKWEGVYDGTTCIGLDRTIPLPPTA